MFHKKIALLLSFVLIPASVHPSSDTQSGIGLWAKVAIATATCFTVGAIGGLMLEACKPDPVAAYCKLDKITHELAEKYKTKLLLLDNEYECNYAARQMYYSSLSTVKALEADIKQLEKALSAASPQESYPFSNHDMGSELNILLSGNWILVCLKDLHDLMIQDPRYKTDLDNERAWNRWTSGEITTRNSSYLPKPKKKKQVEPIIEPKMAEPKIAEPKVVEQKPATVVQEPKTITKTSSIFDFSNSAADL